MSKFLRNQSKIQIPESRFPELTLSPAGASRGSNPSDWNMNCFRGKMLHTGFDPICPWSNHRHWTSEPAVHGLHWYYHNILEYFHLVCLEPSIHGSGARRRRSLRAEPDTHGAPAPRGAVMFQFVVDPAPAAWIRRGIVQPLMVTEPSAAWPGKLSERCDSCNHCTVTVTALAKVWRIYPHHDILSMSESGWMLQSCLNQLDGHVMPHSSVASNRSRRVAAYAAPAWGKGIVNWYTSSGPSQTVKAAKGQTCVNRLNGALQSLQYFNLSSSILSCRSNIVIAIIASTPSLADVIVSAMCCWITMLCLLRL